MKKKIFCTLISLIIVITLVACGSTGAVTTPAPAEPAVVEPTPEPEPEPVEEVTEPETSTEEEVVEEEPTVEEEAEEPVIEDPIEAALANEEFYEPVFSPKLYAESLGIKWWGDYGGETDFSVLINDVEYFVLCHGDISGIDVVYTDGEICYDVAVVDRLTEDRSDIVKVKTGNTVNENSRLYALAIADILYRLYSKDIDFKNWSFEGLTYGYHQFNCEPRYFDDGFIITDFTNEDKDSSFVVAYNQ